MLQSSHLISSFTLTTIRLLAICLTLFSSCAKPDNHSLELFQEIKSTDKMVLASMSITKTAKTERTDWYKIGKRIAVYSYDSYMRAYIDLSSLQMEDLVFDDNAMTVKVTLPPIVTEVAGRDMQMKKVYENIGPLRSEIDAKERAQIKELANKSFKKEVAENPEFRKRLTEAAKRKARRYFESIFEAYGYSPSIDFKN